MITATAIFPEKKYVVYDSGTNCYITNFDSTELYWTDLLTMAIIKTKEEWIYINPAYESMLEEVEEWWEEKK